MLFEFLLITLLAVGNAQEQATNQSVPSWESLSQMWSQIGQNDFNLQTFSNMIEIFNSIQEKMIHGNNLSDHIKGEELLLQIRPEIIHRTVEYMKAALLSSNYSGNNEIQDLADAISNVNETFFDEIISSVINESIYKYPMDKLIDELSGHKKILQNVVVLLRIDSVLKEHANFSEDLVLELTEKLLNDFTLTVSEVTHISLNLLKLNGNVRNQVRVIEKISQLRKLDEFQDLSEDDKVRFRNFLSYMLIRALEQIRAASTKQPRHSAESLFALWSQVDDIAQADFNLEIFSIMIKIYTFFEENMSSKKNTLNAKRIDEIAVHIRHKISHYAVKRMSEALLSNNYRDNKEIQQIANEISKVSETFFEYIITQVIEESVQLLPMNKIIDELSGHNKITQNIAALLRIKYFLDNFHNFNLQQVINGTHLSENQKTEIRENLWERESLKRNQAKVVDKIIELVKSDEYENVSQADKVKVQKIINNLSTSLRNLYFSSEVCIRSIAFGDMYLSVVDFVLRSGFPSYRLQLTCGQSECNEANSARGKWIPNQIGEQNFRFGNKYYKNRYINIGFVYTADLEIAIDISHLVDEKEFNWEVQAIDNNIYIYSRKFKRYLCIFDSITKYVVRAMSTSRDCLWVVEKCDN